MSTLGSVEVDRRDPAWGRAALALVVLQLGLLVHGAWVVGPTYDEHFYVASGYSYWREGDFALNREHPPLVKLLCAAPLFLVPGVESGVRAGGRAVDTINYPVAFLYQENAERLDLLLFLARLPVCLLTAASAWIVFGAARRRFGGAGGVVALGLYAFNPNVLAHGRLVSLDAGAAPFVLVAALAFLRLLEGGADPTGGAEIGLWPRRLGAAVALGLACLAKFTALILIPVFGVLALVSAATRRSPRPVADVALVLLGALGTFAAGYGFEAKSINEAWATPEYVREAPAREVTPAELADALAAAGASDQAVERVRGLGSLSAAVIGMAAAVEYEAEPAPVVAALAALARGREDLRKHAFRAVLAAAEEGRVPAGVALPTLAALAGRTYPDLAGYRTFHDELANESWGEVFFFDDRLRALTRGLFGDDRPIPLLTALKGLDQTLAHGRFGHGSYFRGRTLAAGRDFAEGNPHPEYYAVVMGVKNPVAALLLLALAVGLAFVPGRFGRASAGTEDGATGWTWGAAAVLVGLPLLAFAVFSFGRALLGVRYLLPILPLVCVAAGRVARFRFGPLPGSALGLGLAGLAAVPALLIHPHQLMYYNRLAGGPEGGPAITVVGDDWGQDARAVGRFLAEHAAGIEAAGGLVYRPYSTADPAALGLEGVRPPSGPERGIVAVHAIDLHREAHEFGWLAEYEPFLVIGHAVYLYDTRPGPPGGDPLPGWNGIGKE